MTQKLSKTTVQDQEVAFVPLRQDFSVAICTLMDDELQQCLQRCPELSGVLVGSLHTENIGIEHIINFVAENPNIRFIVVCGVDGSNAVGHLPGQTLLALGKHGIDETGRIVGAQGKRPVLKNVSPQMVAHFQETVELVDLMGCQQVPTILETIAACEARSPGPAHRFQEAASEVETFQGVFSEKMVFDPKGYFVIRLDGANRRICLEHYENSGRLTCRVEGATGPEVYCTVIAHELLSRLDHAAYLGRELARAQMALEMGMPFVQDQLTVCGD